jgi:glycosyltransferase involved in cell wall biosynthesis
MLYICIPSRNEAPTVGLLLWKIRQVFTAAPREYQLLVGDDASTDATREVLAPYAKVLPLTILRQERHQGYARTVEDLLRHAVTLSDRPRRDAVVVLHADFLHDPATIPDLLKKFDSGADLVVADSWPSLAAAVRTVAAAPTCPRARGSRHGKRLPGHAAQRGEGRPPRHRAGSNRRGMGGQCRAHRAGRRSVPQSRGSTDAGTVRPPATAD